MNFSPLKAWRSLPSSPRPSPSGRESTNERSRFGPLNRGGAPVSNRLGACVRAMPVTNRRSGSWVGTHGFPFPQLTGRLAWSDRGMRLSLSLGGRFHEPPRLTICSPERPSSVLPVWNRQFPRGPDCQLQTGSTFMERARVRGNDASVTGRHPIQHERPRLDGPRTSLNKQCRSSSCLVLFNQRP